MKPRPTSRPRKGRTPGTTCSPIRCATRARWDDIQAGFVDEPRRSVTDADALVAEVIDEITAVFAAARTDLEDQWSRGDEASTEDLRLAFRRYRGVLPAPAHRLSTRFGTARPRPGRAVPRPGSGDG